MIRTTAEVIITETTRRRVKLDLHPEVMRSYVTPGAGLNNQREREKAVRSWIECNPFSLDADRNEEVATVTSISNVEFVQSGTYIA